MADYKYKKGDSVLNGKGKLRGYIIKAEKDPDDDTKNKYSIEELDGTVILLDEHNIIETEYYIDKNKI